VLLAFKSGKRSGFAFGLQPYSSVSYQLTDTMLVTDGEGKYQRLIDGNGGISQVFGRFGMQHGKHFAWGVEAAWMFGSIQQDTYYTLSSVVLDLSRQQRDYYNGVQATAGIQYFSKAGNVWQHTIGFTATYNTDLTGYRSLEYLDGETAIAKAVDNSRRFSMPLGGKFGYSASSQSGITLSAEFGINQWDRQKLAYSNSYTQSTTSGGIGIEYRKLRNRKVPASEKYFIGAGLHYEQSYISIRNTDYINYAASVGGGIHLSPNLTVNGTITAGTRGKVSDGLINEQYTQFNIGFTVKDFWMNAGKFGRFN